MDLDTIQRKNVQPFPLKKLPPKADYLNTEIVKELLAAHIQIAELKGYCLDYPNPLLLLSPAIIKESLASSEIEDVHTTLIHVLQNALLPEVERRPADKEVLRYREAVMFGFATLSKRPILSAHLMVNIQNTLMQLSGSGFRTDQNAIINQRTKEIIFVPPNSKDINGLVKNWEMYVNTPSTDIHDDPLIKSAIAHYQFESIHPFNDGNGRTGRILMVLQLINAGLLTVPILYISGYINKNKTQYYQLLKKVTTDDAWSVYILFMITGFKEQAAITKKHLLGTKSLFEETKDTIKEALPSIYSHELIEAIFTMPIVTPTVLSKKINVHHITAGNYLRKLEQLGIMHAHIYGRHHMYSNVKLLQLLNN